jgi:transposase
MSEYPTKKKSDRGPGFSPYLYRPRNLVEEHCWRLATRYDELGANYLAFVQLASTQAVAAR